MAKTSSQLSNTLDAASWGIAVALLYYVFAQLALPYAVGLIAPSANFPQSAAGRALMLQPAHEAMTAALGPYFDFAFLPLLAAAAAVHYAKAGARAWVALFCVAFFVVQPIPLLMMWSWYLDAFVCRNGPILSRAEAARAFPRFERIEGLWHAGLRDECERVLSSAADRACIHDTNPGFTIGESAPLCWRAVHLKHLDRVVHPRLAEYPLLAEIVADPRVYNAFFSILDPGVGIPAHTGYSKSFLRYHLGVRVPGRGACLGSSPPFIVVGAERHEWKEGVGVVFDDMFRHYVENHCSEERVVLYLDLRRDLHGLARRIDEAMMAYIGAHPVMRSIVDAQHKTQPKNK